ncbi:MAG: DNA cytosine methyltransferase, partial [Chthoniobacteraceae bacterium]
EFPPAELAKLIGTNRVDVIAGGPPCQGFSGARKVDGTNHGDRLKDDPRRLLFREYLRYVAHFQPRVFIMENVLGLQTAAGGAYFTAVQHEARLLGYRVASQVADAFALGVPQKRKRQLIIGVRGDLPGFFPSELTPAPRAFPGTTLGPAIGDLPVLAAGKGEEDTDYDLDRRGTHLGKWGKVARRYLYRVLEVAEAPMLTAPVRTAPATCATSPCSARAKAPLKPCGAEWSSSGHIRRSTSKTATRARAAARRAAPLLHT